MPAASVKTVEKCDYSDDGSSFAASSRGDETEDSDVSAGKSTVDSRSELRAMVDDEDVCILCVGLMQTGLKTLGNALSSLGYTAIYDQKDVLSTYEQWDDVMKNKATAETFRSIFKGKQVVMGLPTFCFWEQILEAFPNTRVILTVRDEDEWWESIQQAKKSMDSDLPGAPLQYGSALRAVERVVVPSYHRFCEVLRFAWATTVGAYAEGGSLNEAAARRGFRHHNNYVQQMLKRRKFADGHHQLLVTDVSKGLRPLCKFLGNDEAQVSVDVKSCDDIGSDDLLDPSGEFGVRMRKELRWCLVMCFAALTAAVGAVLAVHVTNLAQVPVMLVAIVYILLLLVGWTCYVIMHSLVMRVSALVVLPLALKSLLIAGSLQVCFIIYGILKEMIVTKDRIASPVLILSSRLMSVICAVVALLLTDGRVSFGGAPLYSFSAFGLTNEASTWAGYEMLKYVSFPVQVMAKSCKLLPNMIMGRVVNGTRYPWSQYIQAVGAMVCVTVMQLSDEGTAHKKGKSSGDDGMGEGWRMLIGISLLIMFFACDSFTSQYQTGIYKQYSKVTQTQMMLAGNVVGVMVTMISIVTRWTSVQKSLAVMLADPAVMGRVLALGLSGALGQFCIYTAIKVLGPLAFTWIMTSRQLISVLISLVMFGHGVSCVKLGCIFTVFAIMSAKQLSRAVPHGVKACKTCTKSATPAQNQDSGSENNDAQLKGQHALSQGTSFRFAKRGSQTWGIPGDEKTE